MPQLLVMKEPQIQVIVQVQVLTGQRRQLDKLYKRVNKEETCSVKTIAKAKKADADYCMK